MKNDIPDGTTLTLEINEDFLQCLTIKPKIPGIILRVISRQMTIIITNKYICPLSSLFEEPLRSTINSHYKFCAYFYLVKPYYRSLNRFNSARGIRVTACEPGKCTSCLVSNVTDLNDVYSNNLMNALLEDDLEFWRSTVLSLDRTSEPINQCIEDSGCAKYIDGIE